MGSSIKDCSQFLCMIEHGSDIKSQLRFEATTTDLAMSHILSNITYLQSTQKVVSHRGIPATEKPHFGVINLCKNQKETSC